MPSTPLNAAQSQAVHHAYGPLLVLAGAGSGKTRVITHRITELLGRGIPAQAILALTFTNRAAAEMRERTLKLQTSRGALTAARALTISTFHAFGLQVLTRERAATGGMFTIFDQGDVLSTIKELLRDVQGGKSLDVAALAARISKAKNLFQNPEELPDDGVDEYDEITKIIYPRYQTALRNFRAVDFDDLVCGVVHMWRDRPDILARWQERFQFILVDEYQDTNRAQLELLRLLAGTSKNLTVVGDDDQSIYAWRGADVRNILEFEHHFPGAKVVKLEQNYRSRSPVLAVANAVIAKRSDSKYRKVLFTDRAGGEKVRRIIANTPDVEARFVAREIKRFSRDEGIRLKEIAVLYRSNGQAKLIEEALREETIPHRVVGGQQFYERKEVKDVLSYLKLAINPADEISLRRIVNFPPRGIGDTSLEKLALYALAKGWTLWQAVERVDGLDEIAGAGREGCRSLEKIMNHTRHEVLVEKQPASVVARSLVERIGLNADLDAASTPQVAARRRENIEALIRTLARREKREAGQGHDPSDVQGLQSFLHALTLNFNDESDGPTEVVTLSTLHGAKGLEFDVVFLIGCEEGLLPHSRTLDTRITDAVSQDIEEERRLFYVGVTRAREMLFLSRAKTRLMRGKPVQRTPSRFVVDIPSDMVIEEEVKDLPKMSTTALQAQADALLATLNSL